MCMKCVTTVEKLYDCITTKVQKSIRHATLSQVSLDISKNNICTIVILKFKHTMMQYHRDNGYTQKQHIHKSPSVVHRTLLPSGLTPVGNLLHGPKIDTQEIKHCNILLHYFAQQQEHQVAYSVKQKKIQSTN